MRLRIPLLPILLSVQLVLFLAAAPPLEAGTTPVPAVGLPRIFEEPLVPVGGEPKVAETDALRLALLASARKDEADAVERLAPLQAFLRAHPNTAWKASLLLDLGLAYRAEAYFSRAASAFQEAWMAGRNCRTTPWVADRALAEWIALTASLGRVEDLETLLGLAEHRTMRGVAAEKVSISRQSLWVMRHQPEHAFLCGPAAVQAVGYASGQPHPDRPPALPNITARGTNLQQIADYAQAFRLGLQAAKRQAGSSFPVPSVVHWKQGHFSALLKAEGGAFLVSDPLFPVPRWISSRVLEEEASGYALIDRTASTQGWDPVQPSEAGHV